MSYAININIRQLPDDAKLTVWVGRVPLLVPSSPILLAVLLADNVFFLFLPSAAELVS
jgi:hypothetical protein